MTKKIGLEAEYILMGLKDKLPLRIPYGMNADTMPLLGEIRSKPGTGWGEVVGSFQEEYYKTLQHLSHLLEEGSYQLMFLPSVIVPRELYKECMADVDLNEKNGELQKVRNILGTDIEDQTDQVLDKRKVVGYRISCGLHIHFSDEVTERKVFNKPHYEAVDMSVTLPGLKRVPLDLYRKVSDNAHKHELEVTVSRMTSPAVEYIVGSMDEAFFERFAPPREQRTRYRQPGFYERKPYGFEYRSLPATDETIAALPELTKYSFELLQELDDF